MLYFSIALLFGKLSTLHQQVSIFFYNCGLPNMQKGPEWKHFDNLLCSLWQCIVLVSRIVGSAISSVVAWWRHDLPLPSQQLALHAKHSSVAALACVVWVATHVGFDCTSSSKAKPKNEEAYSMQATCSSWQQGHTQGLLKRIRLRRSSFHNTTSTTKIVISNTSLLASTKSQELAGKSLFFLH